MKIREDFRAINVEMIKIFQQFALPGKASMSQIIGTESCVNNEKQALINMSGHNVKL